MKSSIIVTAAAFSLGVSAFAQTPAQDPGRATTTAPAERVTIIGCVQKEADYRRGNDAGRGGVVGTGLGTGNEFVLVNATAGGTVMPSAVGTSGSTAASTIREAAENATMSYELSGPQESKLEAYAGRRVEITGMLKAQAVGPAGPTGGPDAKLPLSQDLKLRELEVGTFRGVDGTCPIR